MNTDPMDDYARFVTLRIGDADFQVPESSSLLLCFQYLKFHSISMGGFCWNADCHTCEVTVRDGLGSESQVLSCQTTVAPNMTIVGMTEKLKFCLRDLVR